MAVDVVVEQGQPSGHTCSTAVVGTVVVVGIGIEVDAALAVVLAVVPFHYEIPRYRERFEASEQPLDCIGHLVQVFPGGGVGVGGVEGVAGAWRPWGTTQCGLGHHFHS